MIKYTFSFGINFCSFFFSVVILNFKTESILKLLRDVEFFIIPHEQSRSNEFGISMFDLSYIVSISEYCDACVDKGDLDLRRTPWYSLIITKTYLYNIDPFNPTFIQ